MFEEPRDGADLHRQERESEPELDLDWLDQVLRDDPDQPPAEEPPRAHPQSRDIPVTDEPTRQIPTVPQSDSSVMDEPTRQIPTVTQQDIDLMEALTKQIPAEPQADHPAADEPVMQGFDAPQTEEPTMQIPVTHGNASQPDTPPVHGAHAPGRTVSSDKAPTAPLPKLPRRETVAEKTASRQNGIKGERPRRSRTGGEASQGERKIGLGLLLGVVSGALVLALVLGVFLYGLVLKSGKTIYPNVYIAGINVGGMTKEEASGAVDEAVLASYASATMKVQLPDRTLSFSPEQTDVVLDPADAIEQALDYGRSGNPFSAVTTYFSSRHREHYVDLQSILNLDKDYIRQELEKVAKEIETEAAPSQVRYDDVKEQLIIQVGYPERHLDVDGLYDVVYQNFMNGEFTTVVWDYDETARPTVDLASYVQKYGQEPVDARYDEKTHTIVESVPGFGFDLEKAQQQVATAAPGCELVISMEEREPEVTTEFLEKEMFGQVLFETSTKYVNNPGRTKNLTLACEAIDGTILNPGETFSFNDVVGERTAEKGYQAATVYSGGESLQELGGGVCQVASTLYYATLHLNLEQVQRQPHQFAVTYVPYGMDATVYWGKIDYQFKNTLSHPLKIEADTKNGHVNVRFLGIPDNDNYVEMNYEIKETYPWSEVEEVDETKEPGYREIVVTPYTGYRVVTYKTIFDKNGNQLSKKQEAVSVYEKRDQKVVVGPEKKEEPADPWNPGGGTVKPEPPKPPRPEPPTPEPPKPEPEPEPPKPEPEPEPEPPTPEPELPEPGETEEVPGGNQEGGGTENDSLPQAS